MTETPGADAVNSDAAGHGAIRAALLEACLPHVAFDGWTTTMLRHGAKDAGLEWTDVLRACPGGVAHLLDHVNADADRRMIAALEAMDLGAIKVRERITIAVRLRLEQNAAHREAIRRGLAYLALPQHGGLALKCLYRTVNAIWYAAGDTATDYNFYTKRGLLAAVYSATIVYWLADESKDGAPTWAFLDRRIADVMKVPRAMARIRALAATLPDPFGLARDFTARRNPVGPR